MSSKFISAETVRSGLLAVVAMIAGAILGPLNAPLWLLIVTLLLFLAVALALKWLLATKARKVALAVVTVAYSVLLVFGLLASRPRFEASFQFGYHFVSPRDDDATFWQAVNVGSEAGCHKALVDLILAVRLESVQKHPTLISDIRVEGATANGEWVALKRLSYSKMYVVRPDSTVEMSMDLLDTVLVDKIVRPHEPLRGALVLQYPRTSQIFKTNRFRLVLVDARGSQSLDLAFWDSPLQTSQIRAIGPADISKCRIEGPATLLLLRKSQ